MRLPKILAASFLLAGCSATQVVAKKTHTTYEERCKIWLNYHSDCISQIRVSENSSQLSSLELEARETRNAISEEIKYSDMAYDRAIFWQEKTEIAKGEAIIAATDRHQFLKNKVVLILDQICQEAEDCGNFFISQNDNGSYISTVILIESICQKLKKIENECKALDLEEKYQAVFSEINKNYVEIQRAFRQRTATIIYSKLVP